ncbi:unnamed protein product [Prorocentrum cordatum]|uniref:Uncharacterized protein n=1 Tax=Prorocentrum cordatum TaxID=2364126 RepID=A0ABN9RGF4_9DINO|nr:unnamed protein product [Polarella glacialis]
MAAAVAGGGAALPPAWPGAPGGAAARGRQVRLSDGLVQSLAVGKVYSDHRGPVGSLDFTHDGLYLATAGEDDRVHVYSCDRAERARHLRCEKYGVGAVRFLHNSRDCALASSRSATEHVVKHWDFQENKYVRLFRSHTARVTSLSPHPYEDGKAPARAQTTGGGAWPVRSPKPLPCEDTFLSGSADATVLLWDLRRDRPTARIGGAGLAVASFDQQGLVFVASIGRTKLHLFGAAAGPKLHEGRVLVLQHRAAPARRAARSTSCCSALVAVASLELTTEIVRAATSPSSPLLASGSPGVFCSRDRAGVHVRRL